MCRILSNPAFGSTGGAGFGAGYIPLFVDISFRSPKVLSSPLLSSSGEPIVFKKAIPRLTGLRARPYTPRLVAGGVVVGCSNGIKDNGT